MKADTKVTNLFNDMAKHSIWLYTPIIIFVKRFENTWCDIFP